MTTAQVSMKAPPGAITHAIRFRGLRWITDSKPAGHRTEAIDIKAGSAGDITPGAGQDSKGMVVGLTVMTTAGKNTTKGMLDV
ncbi:hypothetical protein [Kushneria phosphatilytica]|uniref:Uncharacterized protein n=1 Tax=Kushneria phosphatilytica TaxID=657387 RepID=A0A5C1A0W7_9GAMM|nr:hypothetical protein [Kushneria phosphatilytica]QEL11788.1 hypothetical protein FY550_11995 [Kushneria phosphatilytica]